MNKAFANGFPLSRVGLESYLYYGSPAPCAGAYRVARRTDVFHFEDDAPLASSRSCFDFSIN